jgi:hypothetical protein
MNMCAWASASRRRAPCWGASRGARGSSSWPCPRALHGRVGLGLETTGALLGCEPRCARFLFVALSSLCMCAWAWASRRQSPCWGASRGARGFSSWPCPRSAIARGLGPRDDGRLAGVRAEVRAVSLRGLVLSLCMSACNRDYMLAFMGNCGK